MKICILGSTYPRFDADPQVPWLRQTANRLANRGHQVTIAASSYCGGKHHEIDGLKVLRYRYAPAFLEKLTHDEGAPSKLKNKFYKLLAVTYILLGAIQFFYWCVKNKYDVVHVHWPFPHALFVILPRLLLGVTVVCTTHGAGLAMARKSKLIKAIFKFVLGFSSLNMTNSSHTKKELKRLTGFDSNVIHYGSTVGLKKVDSKQDRSQASNETRILFSGRLIQRKGVDYLLKALPAVLKHQNVKLFITGNGDRRDEWQKLAFDLEINQNVSFLGFVSNEELAKQYALCDIYCLPAIYDDNNDTEGLGVVLIEALLYSKPVISTNVGGIIDVIKNNETGLLVEEKNSEQLANAILKLINNPKLAQKLGQAGAEHVLRNFSWRKIIDEVEELISQAHTADITASSVVSESAELV